MPGFTFTASVLGTPDPPGLARFYQRLLGWPLRDDTAEWATLRPPVWPPEPGTQQMQQHLDFLVDDLDAACALAEDAGAEPVSGHEDEDEIVRVFRDPAGHPFCLSSAADVRDGLLLRDAAG